MNMPDYTDVPALGETTTGETTRATKADSDDEIMEVDEEKVVEKDKIENVPEVPKIMIDGENVSEINKDSDSGKIAENNDKTMSENLEVEKKDLDITQHKKGEEHEEKKNGINSEELVKDSNKDVKSENNVVEKKDATEKIGTTESEDVVMVEDDVDILEAFKTASSLIADLSPCKVDSSLTDKKDTSNVAEQATPDIHSKVNLIDKLVEESTQLDKSVEAEAKSSETEVQPSQSIVPPSQDKMGNTSVRPFGSPLVQEVQKDLCLIKSSSFGFTPSSVSDVATLAIGSSCVSSGSTLSSPLVVTSPHTSDHVSSQRIFSAPGSTLSSPLVTTSPHTSDHVSSQRISSAPGSTVSSPLVTTSHHTSDHVLSQRISSAPGSTLSSPLVTTPHTSDHVLSQRISSVPGSTLSSPLVTTSPHTSDHVLSQRSSSAFGSTLSSPLITTAHSSDYVSSQRIPSPNVGSILASPTGIPSSCTPDYVSSQRTTSPAVRSDLSSPLAPSSSQTLDLASVQRTVAQDHGYTAPPLGTLPVPNLQISVNQPHTGMGNAKLSPILSSYLASPPGSRLLNNASSQNSSPNVPFSVKSPLMRQNSAGFGAYSMATGNNQTGYEGQNLLNIPVTQSLQKSMDTGSQPTSMFIADFDDQSPGGRKGQKRKRISMATEEIMMYGKRRSARVS